MAPRSERDLPILDNSDLPYPPFHPEIDNTLPELMAPFGTAVAPLVYMTALDNIRQQAMETAWEIHQFFLAFLEPPAAHRPELIQFALNLEVPFPIRYMGGWPLMQRTAGSLLPVTASRLWVWHFVRSVKVGVANGMYTWRRVEVVVCPRRLINGGNGQMVLFACAMRVNGIVVVGWSVIYA